MIAWDRFSLPDSQSTNILLLIFWPDLEPFSLLGKYVKSFISSSVHSSSYTFRIFDKYFFHSSFSMYVGSSSTFGLRRPTIAMRRF